MVINLTPHALLFTLASIGISESSYLIRARQRAQRPVCPVGQGCETVLNSTYNRMFLGIHNDIAGMAFYLALAVIAGLLVAMDQPPSFLTPLAVLLLAGATLASLALFYLQWRVIRAWCFWCLMSAGTIVFMDIILLAAKLT